MRLFNGPRPALPGALLSSLSAIEKPPVQPRVEKAVEAHGGAPHTETWWDIRDAGDVTEIYLYDEIGGWFGRTASDFIAELGTIDKKRTVCLRVNSPGGDVFDGIAILNALRAREGKVTAVVDGLAASAASFIVQGADTVIMGRNAELMIHNAQGMCVGEASDMRDTAELLDRVSTNIATIYAERSGVPVGTWRDRMSAETWYSAEEAVSAGLADTVAESDLPTRETAALQLKVWDLSPYRFQGRAAAPSPNAPVSADPTRQEPGPDPVPAPGPTSTEQGDGLDLDSDLVDLIRGGLDGVEGITPQEDVSDMSDLLRSAAQGAQLASSADTPATSSAEPVHLPPDDFPGSEDTSGLDLTAPLIEEVETHPEDVSDMPDLLRSATYGAQLASSADTPAAPSAEPDPEEASPSKALLPPDDFPGSEDTSGLDLTAPLSGLLRSGLREADSPEDLSDTPELLRLAVREARLMDYEPVASFTDTEDAEGYDPDYGLEPVDPSDFYNAMRNARF